MYNDINIKETIQKFADETKNKGYFINEITVLKDNIGDLEYIKKTFKENTNSINIDILTHSDFIWEFCIDSAIKIPPRLYTANLFIDQEITKIDDQGNGKSFSEASFNLTEELKKDQQCPASIIIAPGGMGKTTLCHNIINRLGEDKNSISILISSEMIRQSHIGEIISNSNIESIYDLYDAFLKVNHSTDKEFISLDKNTFELGVLCGKIVVIIDGLDEFISTFQGKFNLGKFIDSLKNLSDQLGKSKILLTSRENIIEQKTVIENSVVEYHLMGFDEERSIKYLERRFRKYSDNEQYIKKAKAYILDIISNDPENRAIPFFVDLISSLLEEHEGSIQSFNFEISLNEKDYESNSELLDLLVFSVLRRERIRQRIPNTTAETMLILQELSAENGESFQISKLEEKVDLYFDDPSKELATKISRNPLLVNTGEKVKYKYDILPSYFLTLHLIDCINSSCIDYSFTKLLSRYAFGNERIFKEIVKYFKGNKNGVTIKIKSLISKNLKTYNEESTDDSKKKIISKSISSLLHLHYQVCGQSMTKTELMDSLQNLYNSKNQQTISNLFIYGEYPALDFTNMKIWKIMS